MLQIYERRIEKNKKIEKYNEPILLVNALMYETEKTGN